MTSLLVLLAGCDAVSLPLHSEPIEPEAEGPTLLGDAPTTDTGGWDPDAPLPLLLAQADGPFAPEERVGAWVEGITEHDGSLGGLVGAPRSFEGRATLEIRGASSVNFPKHSYNFELQDETGADRDVAVFGMPPEADWVLYGPYSDKALVRDALAYRLARRMGDYAPRVRFAELALDGAWQGVYQVTEKPELDPDRVAMPEASAEESGDLTGAYLFKYEGGADDGGGWRSARGVGYELQDPSADEITPGQRAYLTGWMDDFEAAMARGDAPADWVDVRSFVDFVIINELSRNVDAFRRSTYLHKAPDALGGRLHAGPVWDFNIAWGNADFCGGWDPEGLAWEADEVCADWRQIPSWWLSLLRDWRFTAALRCRWEELRGTLLADAALTDTIDALARPLAAAEARDQAIWPTLGHDIWPNYYVGETWQDELAYLRQFTTTRAAWLDENLPGRCPPSLP